MQFVGESGTSVPLLTSAAFCPVAPSLLPALAGSTLSHTHDAEFEYPTGLCGTIPPPKKKMNLMRCTKSYLIRMLGDSVTRRAFLMPCYVHADDRPKSRYA